MSKRPAVIFDEIGNWSEVKLDIVKEYAAAYSRILSAQRAPGFYHIYIDAFAGSGLHASRSTGHLIPGSPMNALGIQPPFQEYHLIDLDRKKVSQLRRLIGSRSDVYLYTNDCNQVLLSKVFPQAPYEKYRRALCLLDPYGLHLHWSVLAKAGSMKSIEVFLNFPVADINRNVLWRNPEGVDPSDIQRMNDFWGDESWKRVAYNTGGNLFGFPEKEDNETIAQAFRDRLRTVGGFTYVPDPIPMRNKKGATVYYLFFASHKPAAANIVHDIFNKYRGRVS